MCEPQDQDFSVNVPGGSNNTASMPFYQNQDPQESSPLLRTNMNPNNNTRNLNFRQRRFENQSTFSGNKFNHHNVKNRLYNNGNNGQFQTSRGPLPARLGGYRQQPQEAHPDGPRKREFRYGNDKGDFGPPAAKRRWHAKPYSKNRHDSVSVQNRIDKIRNQDQNVTKNDDMLLQVRVQNTRNFEEDGPVNNIGIGESEASDLTVQFVNPDAQRAGSSLSVFRMQLDPRFQAAIKSIQDKRKGPKQPVYPFTVTPIVTGMSTHERFTMLSML